MSQQYSLRWNNHQPNFISMFTTLLNTQTLVDVTLAAEGKHLQAHKVVLSACSTYFQSLFMDNPSRHPIVILKDVSFADLRTMVDFMYYGEVNVTEEQLPQVLDTAKLLKIKGLTEMPDSTSLTRAQGGGAGGGPGDFEERHSASPATSPSHKRKRRRKSSTSSTQLSMVEDQARGDDVTAGGAGGGGGGGGGGVDLVRGDAITLSSVPQQRRLRDFHDERDRAMDSAHQTTDQQNLSVEQMAMDANSTGMPQESSSSSSEATLRLRRAKYFKRQSRLPGDGAAPAPAPSPAELRRQASEPAPAPPRAPAPPALHKHDSYPQYMPKNRRLRTAESEGALQIRAVAPSPSPAPAPERGATPLAGAGGEQEEPPPPAHRASHTPAVRSGPPLSCNFCWNTVDECGRILRRKTQYHCPECRTNLCIVPCFHEYHEGPELEHAAAAAAATSAR